MEIKLLRDCPFFINEIAKLFYNEWHQEYPEVPFSEWENGIRKYTNGLEIPTTLVAVDNKELIGTVSIVKHDMKTRLELSPWLAGLFVKEEYRKLGVGKRLINEIEQIAISLGIRNIYLYTDKNAEYYKTFQWEIIEETKYRKNIIKIMMKQISPHTELKKSRET